MQSFNLKLSNNAVVAGIHSIPPPSTSPVDRRPLIVALHGGSYDCQYFDATPVHTASISSTAFEVPFISIDRPCYGRTSSFLPVPEGSDFNRETGSWLHHYILPALWTEFGITNRCNCIVLLCHSFGVMGGIVAAGMHGQEEKPSYPLGGVIASGLGDKQSPVMKTAPQLHESVGPDHVLMSLEAKDRVMFRPGTVSQEVLNCSERLNAISPSAELRGFVQVWFNTWKNDWAANLVAPVMFSLVDDDPFFVTTEEELKSCLVAFEKSVRVDGSLVKGAPHCMELSYWSQGWYARCFGFAMECAASFASP